MPAIIIAIIAYISKDLIKKLLIGAGIGIVSGAIFKAVLSTFIDHMSTSLSGVGGAVLQLCGLFGVDKALSIIIGALAMRAAIMAMQLSFSAKS